MKIREVCFVVVIILVAIAVSLTFLHLVPFERAREHLIEDVPFVGHDPDMPAGCGMFSSQMVFEYLGMDISIPEQIYYTDWASSFGYLTALYMPNDLTSLNDYYFLGDLYGFKTNVWVPDAVDPYLPLDETEWNECWNRVKKCIENDTPVLTNIDPLSLPYYSEELGVSTGEAGSHMIVLVGYDENKGAVWYNDPISTLFPGQANSSYISVSVPDFRNTLNKTQYKKGLVWTYQKVGEPIGLDKRLKCAQERNRQCIEGTSYYLGDLSGRLASRGIIDVEVLLGLDALYAYRNGIDDAWMNWEKCSQREIEALRETYILPQILTFKWLQFTNDKCAEYLSKIGAEEADIHSKFGAGCGNIVERLKQIYDLLGADKIDQKVIGQIDLLLSSTEEELDELISL
jgi:hypothetical protein